MEVIKGKKKRPFLGLLHGAVGTGKTHFATTMPNPIFIGAEELDDINENRLPKIKTWEELKKQLCYVTDNRDKYDTLVIDTLDSLERIVEREITSREKGKSMATAMEGFGRAYAWMTTQFMRIRDDYLEPLHKMGMNILCLAQTVVNQVDDPVTQSTFRTYDLKLYKDKKGVGVGPLFSEWVMAVMMLRQDVIVVKKDGKSYGDTTKERILYSTSRPYLEAKNRYGIPDEIIIEEYHGWDKIEPYYTGFYETEDDIYNNILTKAAMVKDEGKQKQIVEFVQKTKNIKTLREAMEKVERIVRQQ